MSEDDRSDTAAGESPVPDGASDTHTDPAGTEAEPAAESDRPDEPAGDGPRDLVRYARYALLGGLTLLALVATLRFYFAVSNTIDLWVAREYRSLFQAAFNLVVLLLAAIGISWEVRKVSG